MITRLLMAVPVVGVAAASSVEASAPGLADNEPVIARVEQIRHQLRVHDNEAAGFGRRQFAQWYNFPNWPNWQNWDNSANRRDRR